MLNFGMANNETSLPLPRDKTPEEQAAEEFAVLAVQVVLTENADLPVLELLADKKLRPEPR